MNPNNLPLPVAMRAFAELTEEDFAHIYARAKQICTSDTELSPPASVLSEGDAFAATCPRCDSLLAWSPVHAEPGKLQLWQSNCCGLVFFLEPCHFLIRTMR